MRYKYQACLRYLCLRRWDARCAYVRRYTESLRTLQTSFEAAIVGATETNTALVEQHTALHNDLDKVSCGHAENRVPAAAPVATIPAVPSHADTATAEFQQREQPRQYPTLSTPPSSCSIGSAAWHRPEEPDNADESEFFDAPEASATSSPSAIAIAAAPLALSDSEDADAAGSATVAPIAAAAAVVDVRADAGAGNEAADTPSLELRVPFMAVDTEGRNSPKFTAHRLREKAHTTMMSTLAGVLETDTSKWPVVHSDPSRGVVVSREESEEGGAMCDLCKTVATIKGVSVRGGHTLLSSPPSTSHHHCHHCNHCHQCHHCPHCPNCPHCHHQGVSVRSGPARLCLSCPLFDSLTNAFLRTALSLALSLSL